MFGIQIKRAKEIQLKEMESYLQQNANKVDAVAKEKEAGQNQKENRKAQKVRFYHSHVGKILNASLRVQRFTKAWTISSVHSEIHKTFLQAPTAANKTPPNSSKVDFSQMMKIKEEEETPPICHIRAPPRKPSNPVPIDINDDSDCDFELPVRQTPQNSRSIGSKSKVGIFIRGHIIIF